MRLNQVTVGATNFQESLAFYLKVGLRLIVSARNDYARFELPDGEATFSIHLQTTVPQGGPITYFEVDDVDNTIARLRIKGIAFAEEPSDQPWLWREARLFDPAGNEICIFKAGENRRYPPWRLGPIET
ncbi:MAG: VOC family protein [Novosphingobium sp.]